MSRRLKTPRECSARLSKDLVVVFVSSLQKLNPRCSRCERRHTADPLCGGVPRDPPELDAWLGRQGHEAPSSLPPEPTGAPFPKKSIPYSGPNLPGPQAAHLLPRRQGQEPVGHHGSNVTAVSTFRSIACWLRPRASSLSTRSSRTILRDTPAAASRSSQVLPAMRPCGPITTLDAAGLRDVDARRQSRP